MAVPILQREITQLVGLTGFPSVFYFLFSEDAWRPFSIFLLPLPPPRPHWLPNLVLVFSL